MVDANPRKITKEESTAPEGGWGWYVVLGYAVNNVSIPSTRCK